METRNQIELNNKVEKFIALLWFACAHLIYSATQERKARTLLNRSSTMFPLSSARARTHKPWDERTQENLKQEWMLLPRMFAH